MRAKRLDLFFLTDVGGLQLESRVVHYVGVEEFVFVIFRMVAIVMSRPMVECWRKGGEKVFTVDKSDRWLGVELLYRGCRFSFVTTYVPVQRSEEERKIHFAHGSELLGKMRGKLVIGGDLTSHFGRDGVALTGGWIGNYSAKTLTSRKAWQLAEWGQQEALHHVDSHVPCLRRGTWWNSSYGKWYEQDVFLSSFPVVRGRWVGMRTFTMDGCDHTGKMVTLQVPGVPGKKNFCKISDKASSQGIPSAFGGYRAKNKLRVDKLQGGSDWAKENKEAYAAEVEAELRDCEEGSLSWASMASLVREKVGKVCGREPVRQDLPCLQAVRPRILKSRALVAASYKRVQEARGTVEEAELKRHHRQVKQKARNFERRARRDAIVEVCNDLEWATQNHDVGRMYRNLRELGVQMSPVQMRGVEEITAEKGRDHLFAIGGQPAVVRQGVLDGVQAKNTNFDMDKEPEDQEIEVAMRGMRESAGGQDEVTILMLRSGGPKLLREVCLLVRKLWRQAVDGEAWPEEVHYAVVRLLWKGKGSRADLDKYRGICLLTVISRIVARVVALRLAPYAEENNLLENEQWGFRRGRSTRDPILVDRILCELCADFEAKVKAAVTKLERSGLEQEEVEAAKQLWEDRLQAAKTCIALYDIKKAYPNVPREHAWQVLQKVGIGPGLVNVCRQLHEGTLYTVRTNVGDSSTYKLGRGLREGCPSSCVLFNIVHNFGLQVLKDRLDGVGIHFEKGELLESLTLKLVAFADDTTTIGKWTEQQASDRIVSEVFAEFGECIHPDKTEHMVAGEWVENEIEGETLAKSVRLLGGWIDMDGGARRDTVVRQAEASRRWGKLKNQLLRAGLSLKTKGQVLRAVVMSSLLYGSEVRPFLAVQVQSHQALMNKFVRALCYKRGGTTIRTMEGKYTMQDLRGWLGIPTVKEAILARQLAYLGHLGRYEETRIEANMVRSWLVLDGEEEPKYNRYKNSLRNTYLKLIAKVVEADNELRGQQHVVELPSWALVERWKVLARSGEKKGEQWRKASAKLLKEAEKEANQDTWANRHAGEQDVVIPRRRPREGAEAGRAEGFVVCPKCLDEIHPIGYRVHLRNCTGEKTARRCKPVPCPRCGKVVRRLKPHLDGYCKGPLAPVAPVAENLEVVPPPVLRKRLRCKQKDPLQQIPLQPQHPQQQIQQHLPQTSSSSSSAPPPPPPLLPHNKILFWETTMRRGGGLGGLGRWRSRWQSPKPEERKGPMEFWKVGVSNLAVNIVGKWALRHRTSTNANWLHGMCGPKDKFGWPRTSARWLTI